MVQITANILDRNDEPPRFITKPVPYLAVVASNAQAGVSVFRIEAEDVDGGPGAVKYYKENGRYWCRRHVASEGVGWVGRGGGVGKELNSEIESNTS